MIKHQINQSIDVYVLEKFLLDRIGSQTKKSFIIIKIYLLYLDREEMKQQFTDLAGMKTLVQEKQKKIILLNKKLKERNKYLIILVLLILISLYFSLSRQQPKKNQYTKMKNIIQQKIDQVEIKSLIQKEDNEKILRAFISFKSLKSKDTTKKLVNKLATNLIQNTKQAVRKLKLNLKQIQIKYNYLKFMGIYRKSKQYQTPQENNLYQMTSQNKTWKDFIKKQTAIYKQTNIKQILE